MIKKGLGKGLGALISSQDEELMGVQEIRINDVEPNSNQPRKSFDDEKLKNLADSIKKHGIVQPIIVKKNEGSYTIVAGERRWRAAKIAGLNMVPVIVKDFSDKQVMEVALIENIQREDLNPIEEAEAYERLIKEYNMTQEEISVTVGKSRPAIANSLRLLNLVDSVKKYLVSGELSSGHARALLAIEDKNLQEKAAEEIIEKRYNVRDTEKLVKQSLLKKEKKKTKRFEAEISAIEERLKEILGTKVRLIDNKNKGKILIEYYSNEERERIIDLVYSISRK
jgi:ParB family chromosome partitioning protein